MQIGILPELMQNYGGVYQYSDSLLNAVLHDQFRSQNDHHVIFLEGEQVHEAKRLTNQGWQVEVLPPRASRSRGQNPLVDGLREIVGEGPHREIWRWVRRQAKVRTNSFTHGEEGNYQPKYRVEVNRRMRSLDIELMLYASPKTLSFESKTPFIMPIHDLQHRLQPQFPEVSSEFYRREYLFRNGARFATLLLADSEVGKEDILNCYSEFGVPSDRIRVLPFLPASYLNVEIGESERKRVREKYHLPEKYMFYPAQFWPHKNHVRLVEALGVLKRTKGLDVHLVLAGSYSDTTGLRQDVFQKVNLTARDDGTTSQIHLLGYVPDQDMSALYVEAVALCMPTFFGPTNIPVLEAWAFRCPVLTSDIRGVREQVASAALLVDPESAEALAAGIEKLWTDEAVRLRLIELGSQRLASYTPEDYRSRLFDILEEAKDRVRSGNTPVF